MERGSQVWWVYYSVFWPTCLLLVGGAMWLQEWMTRRRRRTSQWGSCVVVVVSIFLGQAGGYFLAREVCRTAGLSREAYTIRVLQRVQPSQAPDPAPVRYSPSSRLEEGALIYVGLPLIVVLFGSCAVMGWRKWGKSWFVVGALGTVFWVAVGVICWRERDYGDPHVDRLGPRDVWKGYPVPWAGIKSGRVIEVRGVGGNIERAELRLEDTQGECVWAARIENLSPATRRDLFAWLRTRANLHESGSA